MGCARINLNEVISVLDLENLIDKDIISRIREVIDNIKEFDSIVGDTPVSEQISVALNNVAAKNHAHDDLVPYAEFNKLKEQVEELMNLVGDTAVSEQIDMAINQTK